MNINLSRVIPMILNIEAQHNTKEGTTAARHKSVLCFLIDNHAITIGCAKKVTRNIATLIR